MASAFSVWRSKRTPSVLMPRIKRNESNGPSTAPTAFCVKARRSAISLLLVTASPATKSLWPPKYFVALCTTISAPNSSGRCRYGVMNVLSTIVKMLCFFAIAATPARSVTVKSGFAGLSTKNALTSGVIFDSSVSRFVVSSMEYVMPRFLKTLSKTRNVPP